MFGLPRSRSSRALVVLAPILQSLLVTGSATGAEDGPALGAGADASPSEAREGLASPSSGRDVVVVSGPSELRVLLEPSPGAPEVTVCMSVDAGPERDPPGAPGASRVLAEMLLPGGYAKGRGDDEDIVRARGGKSELSMSRDLATFCTTAPAVELPLALWVTAGRFTSFGLTERALASALRRLGELSAETDEDVQDGRAPARLRYMAFLGSYEHSHPELPDSSVLEQISLSRLRALHEDSYVAARSVVSISGGFDPEVAKTLVREHLAPVRPGAPADGLEMNLVSQSTTRFSMAEDDKAKAPASWYGWVAPPGKDGLAVEAALTALTLESRLGKKMVGAGRAARDLTLLSEQNRGPRLLRLRVSGTGSRSLGTIEKLLETEVSAVARVGLSEAELLETSQRMQQTRREALLTAPGRARALCEGVLRGLSPNEILAPLEEAEQPVPLTREEVRLAALKYLVPERRSAIEIYPKGWQDPWQTPMPTFHIVSPGETLTSIARQHGTQVAVIVKMNGLSQNKPIYPGDKLKVPRSRKAEVKLRAHTVRRGDTLSGLAVKYGVSARAIAEQNGMNLKQPIRTGETLTIPSAGGTGGPSSSKDAKSGSSSPASGKTHTVAGGETLGGIALKYGVRLSSLAAANGLTTKSLVRVGQTLTIPQDAAALRPGRVVYSTYKVKSGDTLSEIAKRHGVTVTELERANGFSRKSTLRSGQQLKIPTK